MVMVDAQDGKPPLNIPLWPALVLMEANSCRRQWGGQKNAWHSVTDMGRE